MNKAVTVTVKAEPESDSVSKAEPESDSVSFSPSTSTPPNTPPKSTIDGKYGLVATPGGRRSARIASKSATKAPRDRD